MARHEKHGAGEGHGDDEHDTEVVIMGGWRVVGVRVVREGSEGGEGDEGVLRITPCMIYIWPHLIPTTLSGGHRGAGQVPPLHSGHDMQW